MRPTSLLPLLAALCLPCTATAAEAEAPALTDAQLEEYRGWIDAMKNRERGPFARIRWFCEDGTVLPPIPYACREHGGGRQHGEWSENTLALREAGFLVGNVLVEIAPDEVLSRDSTFLPQLLLEQFLIRVDDGWILRGARFYGGAFQVEGETASATAMLEALLMDEQWLERRLLLVVEAARLLPHGVASSALTKIRADAAALEDADAAFEPLRNKIHGRPDASDAASVREYARTRGQPQLAEQYEALAVAIEREADPARVSTRLRELAQRARDRGLRQQIRGIRDALDTTNDALQRVEAMSFAVTELRESLPALSRARDRLVAVDTMIALGEAAFVDSQPMRAMRTTASRSTQLGWLKTLARLSYGTGDLTAYEWQQLQTTVRRGEVERMDLQAYRDLLGELTRAPSWVQRRHAFFMDPAIRHYAQIEPLAREYVPDRLRSSPMLMYSTLLEALNADANALAGVRHSFFGRTVSAGLRSLNPGMARGVLLTTADYRADSRPGVDKILLVPETLADLPPVAGILTENEGNHLSHVQLLARNLGIPNVVVGPTLTSALDVHRGKPVALLSTPAGIVRIYSLSEQTFAAMGAPRDAPTAGRIVVDLDKLDLAETALTPVAALRADASGVSVGPKAAKLGELMYRYPGSVSPGLAIPFGAYRSVLDQPFEPGGRQSAFEWLRAQYAALDAVDDPALELERRNEVLERLRAWFQDVELDPAFVARLRTAMRDAFGPEGSYGVFVRSDTNVEDLPGFTGAGLNLTVPNVVGFDATLAAIRRVWASPFSERAFGWRQALMDKPEHLYAAVLLHKSVNADVSGVMVTQNVDTGARGAITVVTNEGVGGGVEGQSAETLVVDTASGAVTLVSSATASLKRVLLGAGGSALVDASGRERLLSASNVSDLLTLVADIERWFEAGDDGVPLAADVEFGFFENELVLFQIRPFVENRQASANAQLLAIDAPLRSLQGKQVDLTRPPG